MKERLVKPFLSLRLYSKKNVITFLKLIKFLKIAILAYVAILYNGEELLERTSYKKTGR